MKEGYVNLLTQLDGKIPILKAIPFGIQHVLTMFVGNLAPIIVVSSQINMTLDETTSLIQTAIFIAGIASIIQMYPIFKIGSGLPIIMGISFPFVGVLSYVGINYGYETVIGSVIFAGIIEGLLGIYIKYIRKLITKVVSACVVISIGFSLLPVGASSFVGYNNNDFGNGIYPLIGFITLFSSILFQIFTKSYIRQLSVFFGLVVGYIFSCFFGIVDFSQLTGVNIVSLPSIIPYKPDFRVIPMISVTCVAFISAAETIGDTTALTSIIFNREPTDSELSGSLRCDGFLSSFSGLFGCMPLTSFTQNIGLIKISKVINRFAIMIGAVILIIVGTIPQIGRIFATLPEPVLGGCTIMMFGSILVTGMEMLINSGLNYRNLLIASLSLSIGIGFTSVEGLFDLFPRIIGDIIGHNSISLVFLVGVILDLLLPKKLEREA